LRRSVREKILLERYTSPYFHSNFPLSNTDDDLRTVREAVDSEDGKLWEKATVEEITSLDKNEAWDLVQSTNELFARGCSQDINIYNS
jgi:hypothetical protein